MQGDGYGADGRQQDLSRNEIALILERPEQSDPQTLQGIHGLIDRLSGGLSLLRG